MTITINGTTGISGVDGSSATPAMQGADTNTGVFFPAADTIAFSEGGTEVMRVASTANVGIGTTSPAAKLDVGYVDGNVALRVSRDASNRLDFYQGGGISYIDSSPASAQLAFATVGTERARIDSSGNLLVGTTSNPGSGKLGINFSGSTNDGIAIKETASVSGAYMVRFVNSGGSIIGTITQSGTSAVAYNTSSDYRLKENVQPMTGALEKVAALKPCTYTWKSNGSAGQGFIAHELQAVVPDCVTGEKDAVDKDGKPKYQGVDTSFLVATLVAAIQELKAEVDALKGN